MAGLIDALMGRNITDSYTIAPEAKLQGWSPADETRFQQEIRQTPWYSGFVKQFDEAPNLNGSEYNYRAAWQRGIRPELYPYDGTYHWPSTANGESLKATNHPTAWMEDYMQITGGRDPHEGYQVTPNEAAALSKALKYRYGGGNPILDALFGR